MYSEYAFPKPASAGEFIIEVIGADGLKHHVGPFKQREDAENWIAQNPSDIDIEISRDHRAGDTNAGTCGRRLGD